MNRPRTGARLRAADVFLVMRVAPLVAAVRLALWVVPSRVLLRRVAARVQAAPAPARFDPAVARLGWAVRAASRRIPRASCLTQALSAQLLLARRGFSSELKIGVTRDPEKGFAAHAWVLVEGRVLVGGRDTARFRTLPDISTRL